MAQILLPDSDISTGSWVTAPLWSDIDDATGQIQSADNTSPDTCEVGLTNGTDPEVSTGHTIKYTIRKEATGGHSVNFVCDLVQGTTVIATSTQTAFDIVTFTDFSLTISGSEADSITNYSDLRLRLTRSGETGGSPAGRRWIEVQKASFEIPDAPVGDISMIADTADYIITSIQVNLNTTMIAGTASYALTFNDVGLNAGVTMKVNYGVTQIGSDVNTGTGGSNVLSRGSTTRTFYSSQFGGDIEAWDESTGTYSQTGNTFNISGAGNLKGAGLSPTRIIIADTVNGNLETYDFDETNFNQVGTGIILSGATGLELETLTSTEFVYYDDGNDEIRVYSVDGSGNITLEASLDVSGYSTANLLLVRLNDTDFSVISAGQDKLRTYRWNGSSTITQIGNELDTTGTVTLGDNNSTTGLVFEDEKTLLLGVGATNSFVVIEWDGTDYVYITDFPNPFSPVNNVSISFKTGNTFAYTDSTNDQLKTLEFSKPAAEYNITFNDVNLKHNKVLKADTEPYSITFNDVDLVKAGNVVLIADTTAYSITGIDTGLLHNKLIPAETATYVIIFNAVDLDEAQKLIAETATYDITGIDVTLTEGGGNTNMVADTTAYSITGIDTGLLHNQVMSADTTAYNITFNAVDLDEAQKLIAETATYDITFNDVGLLSGEGLVAETATYTITVIDTGLLHNEKIIASTVDYSITFNDVNLLHNKFMLADTTAYSITSIDTKLNTTMIAETATYDITFNDVGLVESGALLNAETAVYTITGIAVNLNQGIRMSAETATYTITGIAVDLVEHVRLVAGVGTFLINTDGTNLVLSKHFEAEANKFAPSNLIVLFELDTTSLGGSILRFTSSAFDENGNPVQSEPIQFNGNTYSPVPVEADGFEVASSGVLPSPRLRTINTPSLQSSLIALGDLVGATFTRIRTFKTFLDNGETPDPTAKFSDDIYIVDRKIGNNKLYVEWELAASVDQEGRMIPGRQILRNFCSHTYRVFDTDTQTFDNSNATCPYTGVATFDVNDAPSSKEDDICGKKLSSCRVRFLDETLPTRAFPGVSRVR